jgi:hypothetical protein
MAPSRSNRTRSSSSALAVKRMKGIASSSRFARILRNISSPSISGIIMSLMIKSGIVVRAFSSPSRPFPAVSSSTSVPSISQMYSRMSGLSSTTRTRDFLSFGSENPSSGSRRLICSRFSLRNGGTDSSTNEGAGNTTSGWRITGVPSGAFGGISILKSAPPSGDRPTVTRPC